jgi:hypothetical protein
MTTPPADIEAILATNPILRAPETQDALRRWAAVEMVINADYPDLTPAKRAVLIGEVMEQLKGPA